ncbi:MAG: DUF4891 domain-containing protein [Bacteroidaceae bacterium]|nr:DUF4891 domain-containing protein [Bacteroidaceae bacterium]MBQ8889542.1 DUF4891 domain-containing protein [Bacteroidaceae bacterium]
MKKICLYLLALILLSSCNETTKSECEKNTATAILWVDRTDNEKLTKYGSISTVKIHANVYSDGTFRIISFCKKQAPEVITYLEKRVAVFTIPQFFFDEGYIEPGKQYLQLRYIPYKVYKK